MQIKIQRGFKNGLSPNIELAESWTSYNRHTDTSVAGYPPFFDFLSFVFYCKEKCTLNNIRGLPTALLSAPCEA